MDENKREGIFAEIISRGCRRMTMSDLDLMDKTARQICAKTLVEIGSMDGCSSMLLGMVARDNGGRHYCIEPAPKARWKDNIEQMALTDYVTHIHGSSPWLEMIKTSDGIITLRSIPQPIDFLLIDGNHRSRWAIVDYHFFFPFVRVGGMIAFHDYNARKGVAAWVRRAIDIILEDDDWKIEEVCHNKTKDRGIIIFRKVSE